MTGIYKLTPLDNQVERLKDGSIVPFDAGNTDYQAYVAWLAQGNTPDPLYSLDDYKTRKWNDFKGIRDQLTAGGFTSFGVVFDSDPDSIQRISSSVQIASIAVAQSLPFVVNWTLKDNTIKSLDAPSMIKVGLDCMAFVQAIFAQGVQYRGQINNALDKQSLDAIVWEQPT